MIQPDAYLLRFGELALKGRNRSRFVDHLVKILKPRVRPLRGHIMVKHQKILLTAQAPPEQVREAMRTVFGIVGVSPIYRAPLDLEQAKELAWRLVEPHVGSGKTFALRGKRVDKRFPKTSMDVTHYFADYLFGKGLDLEVQLKNPDLQLGFNIEKDGIWFFTETWPAGGGLPVDPRLKLGLLLSGGIDSPVAGHLMQRRGAFIEPIYFHTPPFTVEAAKEKVVDLAAVLARYQNSMQVHVVNFTEAMKAIRVDCEERYVVVLSRRLMMRAAVRIMQQVGGQGLITGESLGQVASQTIENIHAVNHGVPIPILRPLIAMDKRDIIRTAQELGTYEISIQPFDDCCSLFAPADPVTRARMKAIEVEERKLGDIDGLIERALENTEVIEQHPEFEAN